MTTHLFGRKPDPAYTERYVRSLAHPRISRDLPRLMAQRDKRDALLWLPLRKVAPNWKRGAQGIGDCVSWGAEFDATLLIAQLAADMLCEFCEAATETIYGGCRVEVHGGKRPMGNEDGASGSWAAEWLRDYGVLLRKDYSIETGNPMHDLRTYSASKAKHMGYHGCGGKDDGGKLDALAKLHPVKDVSLVDSVDAAIAALQAGCPLSLASMVGFEGERNADGIIRRRGQWPHQMAGIGLKWTGGGEPLFRIGNSWGKSAFGPDPGIDWPAISDCSWWIVADDMERILREQDSFAFSKVEGFALPPFDFNDYDWA